MYIRKSKIENVKPLESLPKGKAVITFNGSDGENIWVAKDEENNVMYLLNHALGFYPMPSWGTELPLCETMDLGEMRGETIGDTDITAHPQAYEFCKRFLNDDDSVNMEKYSQMVEEAEAEQAKESGETSDDAEIIEE